MRSPGSGGEIKSVVLVTRLTVFKRVRGAEGMTFARRQRNLKGSTACADAVARAPATVARRLRLAPRKGKTAMAETWTLSADCCFDPDPSQRACARELYATVRDVPIVSPHGHVDPALLADPHATFGTPADLFIIPDHYVFRMLYSQGIALEDLGVPTRDGHPVERDHRRIWQTFAEHFYLFRGTPTGLWLSAELAEVFGVDEKLSGASAQRLYDHLAAQLVTPAFAPRALFKRFNIEHLCTTDPATSGLEHHRALHAEGWGERVRPTFRPDAVVNLDTPGWRAHIERLGELAGVDVVDYASFVHALEARRA